MYLEHFNLASRPFNLRPDPAFLFPSEQHKLALAVLEYGLLEQDGYVVVTGEVGSGKTTLVRHLLGKLEPDFEVGLITNTHSSFGDLLHWVTAAFGLRRESRTDAELHQTFIDHIIGVYARGRKTLLIVDEAQNLDTGSLEEIRVLSNINADGSHVLQLLLVGQPELREKLADPRVTQIAQRISTHFHLDALAPAAIGEYINHRLWVAGASRPLFSQRAVDLIGRASGGVPRLINQIAETALVYAFAANANRVYFNTVEDVLKDRKTSKLLPVRSNLNEDLAVPS
ncbi:MAG: AAA family ATPase [Pseudomonadota bacterium]